MDSGTKKFPPIENQLNQYSGQENPKPVGSKLAFSVGDPTG